MDQGVQEHPFGKGGVGWDEKGQVIRLMIQKSLEAIASWDGDENEKCLVNNGNMYHINWL